MLVCVLVYVVRIDVFGLQLKTFCTVDFEAKERHFIRTVCGKGAREGFVYKRTLA